MNSKGLKRSPMPWIRIHIRDPSLYHEKWRRFEYFENKWRGVW